MINLEGDMRGVTNVMGMFNSIIEDFSSRQNLDVMSSYAAELTAQSFNEYIDGVAESREEELGHMYDWGEVGQEAGRLWRVILGGTSTNKIMTWDYKASRNEVPVGVNDEDTRKGGHIYEWKAPMIENGTRVRISPVNGTWLAIPTNEMSPGGRASKSKGGTMWFSRQTISPPINRIAQGSFTQAWLEHFATVAVKIVDVVLVDEVEDHLDRFNTYMREIPAPKVNAKPMRTILQIASLVGEKIGHRKNGQFMNKMEIAEQALRLQRIGDNLSD